MDIFSSTITSDCSDQNQEQEQDFLEPEYGEYDHVLTTHDVHEDEPQFAKITLEEPIFARYHDGFCSDICRRLKEWETLSLAHYDNEILVGTFNADPEIVIPHSLNQRVLVLSY